jgi:Protein of unknown function (DUF2742)
MSQIRRSPATPGRAASTSPIAESDSTASTSTTGSRQVSWWCVHEFVTAVLNQVNGWPMAGTPAWCALAHDDPQKWAALLDAAQHWALRVETCQVAECEASHAISAAADWGQIGRQIQQRCRLYAEKPWLKRVTAS